MIPLDPRYVRAWVALIALTLGLELARIWWAPDWPWVLLAALYLTVEGVAIARRSQGDTFSEFNWSFLWGGWTRGFLVGGYALFLAERFYLIGGMPGLPEWAPRATLAVGFATWLLFHLLGFGRDG